MTTPNPKYKKGDAVIVTNVGIGTIFDGPELEYEDEEQTKEVWTYLVSFNEINDIGWFSENEMTQDITAPA